LGIGNPFFIRISLLYPETDHPPEADHLNDKNDAACYNTQSMVPFVPDRLLADLLWFLSYHRLFE